MAKTNTTSYGFADVGVPDKGAEGMVASQHKDFAGLTQANQLPVLRQAQIVRQAMRQASTRFRAWIVARRS